MSTVERRLFGHRALEVEGGGLLTLELGWEEGGAILIRSRREGGLLEVEVVVGGEGERDFRRSR